MIQIKRYFKYDPDKHAKNKYNHLLIGIMVVFLVGPLLRMTSLAFPLAACLFFGIVQFALKATIDSKKLLKCCQILVLVALACVLLSQLKSISPATSKVLYVFGRAMHVVFLALTIRLFIKRILVAERVTGDTIKGGICLYLLAGVAWAFLYEIIYQFDSAAFKPETAESFTFFYYSYSTLTSLGFGDITPINDFAISLTCLEAIAGQMFVAVFIARLIGLHIVHKHKPVEMEDDQSKVK